MRRRARELAFKVLFASSVGGVSLETAWADAVAALANESDPDPDPYYDDPLDVVGMTFAKHLLDGLLAHQAEVDRVLEGTIEGWSFGQMAQTDLTILRLATYEALYEPTPYIPLIEVSVKIAKRYGGEDSGRFVNGVMARLLRRIEQGSLAPQVVKGV